MKVPFVDLQAQYATIQADIDEAIKRVVSQSSFIGGPIVEEFETAFAAYQGVPHCVSCANGTDALEIALAALEIGKGDEVIVPSYTWISTASAVHAVGAKAVFVDVDSRYYTMESSKIEAAITERTKAVIPVHFYGLPANMIKVVEIANTHGLRIIEDCAQAHGADINGQRVGGFGDLATFSFYPAKNLGAYGDAGCILASDEELADRCRVIARLGQKGKHNHIALGRNSRMDGLHAAILTAKLPYLDRWISQRQNAAKRYNQLLGGGRLTLPIAPTGFNHVYHLYVIQCEDRDGLMAHLKEVGVSTQIHYPQPLPALAPLDAHSDDYPVAEQLAGRILSLPMYAEISDEQVEYVAQCTNAHLGSPS